MAEKPEEQFTDEDKIARARELYAIGCRNFYVRKYSDAADDLSEASKLFGEVYGIDGAELGDVYLMYAKSLIQIGQEENKLIDVPEEDEDGEDEAEPVENGVDEGEGDEEGSKDEKEEENGVEENGVDNAEAGTSKAAEEGDEADAEGDDEEGGNLEVAWEVLQNAAMIFERVGGNKLKGLMDTYIEMAGISLENGNFDASVTDFNRALAVFEDLDEADQNQRVAAEVNYKVGLCHMMEKRYDESMKSFQKAADIFEEVIKREKAREEQTEDDKSKIKDLEETLNELLNKISEVRDTKAEELEFVKREMMKMYGGVTGAGGSSSSTYDAGASSSSSGGIQSSSSSAAIVVDENKPKATDISHLIKRKKPDSDPIQESPAKKQLVETSPGEKIAFPSDKIAEDETPKVEVVNN